MRRYETWVRHCQTLVATLDVPTPFDLAEFCAHLEKQRGREIRIVGMVIPPGKPCGLWVALPTVDVVFHESNTTVLHRDHIVLHEIGHMLCDHRGGSPLEGGLTDALLPHLDRSVVNRILGRSAYTDIEEREAELIASLILERANRRLPRAALASDVDPAMTRVATVFGATRG